MSTIKLPIQVKVTYRTGAYVTATVLGQRASSTSSADSAAALLVDKLTTHFGLQPGAIAAKQLPAKGLTAGLSIWSIDANMRGASKP